MMLDSMIVFEVALVVMSKLIKNGCIIDKEKDSLIKENTIQDREGVRS